jgi:uncharacterized protein (TIGR02186 family)
MMQRCSTPYGNEVPSWWQQFTTATMRLAAVTALLLAVLANPADAQNRKSSKLPPPPLPLPKAAAKDIVAPSTDAKENVQADVSMRSVPVSSSFNGTEVVIFGAVDNSRQASAESGLYDVVIVVEGTPTKLATRRKSNVAGIWVNSQSITYENIPGYYAIISTRPLDELADPILLRENDIGFDYIRMTPIRGWETGITTADLADFRASVIRVKQKEGLYVEKRGGVIFIGRSLFRATIDLPANVPVGPLEARVYLLQNGQILSKFTTRMKLEREGLEQVLHSFAFDRPLFFGMFTVFTAIGAGLLASTLFARKS